MEDIKNILTLLGIIGTAIAGTGGTIWKIITFIDSRVQKKETAQKELDASDEDDKLFQKQNALLDNQTDMMDMALRIAREADARSLAAMGELLLARQEITTEREAWAKERQELYTRLETLENSYKTTIAKRDTRISALERENTALRGQVKELQDRVDELEAHNVQIETQ